MAVGRGPGIVPELRHGRRGSFQDTSTTSTATRRATKCCGSCRRRFSEGVRQSDFVGRYGGEEFCLLLPRTSLQAAAAIAEKLRLRVAEACISRKVTASFGVSSTEERSPPSARTARRGRSGDVPLEEAGTQPRHDLVGHGHRLRPRVRKEELGSRPSTSALHAGVPIQSVNALMAALIFRDPITAEHSRRVADLCVLAARGQMSEEQCLRSRSGRAAARHRQTRRARLDPPETRSVDGGGAENHEHARPHRRGDSPRRVFLAGTQRHRRQFPRMVHRQSPRAEPADGRRHSAGRRAS